jgi:hypothetical protein
VLRNLVSRLVSSANLFGCRALAPRAKTFLSCPLKVIILEASDLSTSGICGAIVASLTDQSRFAPGPWAVSPESYSGLISKRSIQSRLSDLRQSQGRAILAGRLQSDVRSRPGNIHKPYDRHRCFPASERGAALPSPRRQGDQFAPSHGFPHQPRKRLKA